MNINEAKAAVMEALLEGPFRPEQLDKRGPAVYLLKRDGVPVVSRNVGTGGKVVMEHYLVETQLQASEIRARRGEGLTMAMHWHRREKQSQWKELIDAIPCPFAKDEASEYLRGIILRQRIASH